MHVTCLLDQRREDRVALVPMLAHIPKNVLQYALPPQDVEAGGHVFGQGTFKDQHQPVDDAKADTLNGLDVASRQWGRKECRMVEFQAS